MLERVNKGFTLVEILVTLAILAILLMLSVPSFISIIKRDRLTTHANQLHNTFKYARSEAVKRDQIVQLKIVGLDWTVNTQLDGVSTELRRFSIIHDSISINLDAVDISNLGGIALQKEYDISDGDNSTNDLALCILQSGQSWVVEKPMSC